MSRPEVVSLARRSELFQLGLNTGLLLSRALDGSEVTVRTDGALGPIRAPF